MYHVCDERLRIVDTLGYLFQAKAAAQTLSTTASCCVFVVAGNGRIIAGYVAGSRQ